MIETALVPPTHVDDAHELSPGIQKQYLVEDVGPTSWDGDGATSTEEWQQQPPPAIDAVALAQQSAAQQQAQAELNRAMAAQQGGQTVPPLSLSLTRPPCDLPPGLREDFEADASLGEGAYACVRRLQHKVTGEVVALKVVEKYPLLIRNMLPQLQREIHIQRVLMHPHILRLLNCFEDEAFVYMLLELCAGGTLRTLAAQLPNQRFAELDTSRYFAQICDGVDFMHRSCCVHRDLKLENILLTHHSEVRICDFGWSAEMQVEKMLLTTMRHADVLGPRNL